MGNLSNLFISTSYQSLIHLGNDNTITPSLVELQDGLGNSIGVSVNSAGDLSISGSLTASLEEGYALVGGVGNETKAVPTSSFGSNVDLGPLNQFTASQESKDITLGLYTGSVNQKFTTIGTQSGSWDNSSLNQFTASQDILNDTFATTGSNTFNGDQRITGSLNIQEANSEITLRNASGTGEVKITSGPDFITSFNPASLTGLDTIGANLLSGSFIQVGNTPNGIGVQNPNVNAATAGDVRLMHGSGYNSFQSNRTNGVVNLKGDTITLNGSSSLDSGVKLIVKGQVIASGSLTASLQEGYVWVGDSNGKSKTVATSSFGGSTDLGPLNAFTASQESKDNTLGIYTSSVDTKFSTIGTQSGSWDNTSLNQFTSSQDTKNSNLATYTGSVDTQLTNLSTSQSIDNSKWDTLGTQSGSFILESETGSFARTDVDNVFGGNQTFLNIQVNGTASIAYLESVTGSAKIIGDAFIVLNNDTPAERFAGIIVQDSGSTTTTASFEFDGQTNDWFYEYTNNGGVTTDYGVVLFGPEYNVKGAPTYLTNNRVPKAVGSHHLNDSNISDDGTTVSVGVNLSVTGSIQSNGTSVLLEGALSNLNSFTASQEILNDTFATTGSNTFNGNQTINGSVNLIPESVSINANYIVPFISGSTISKDSVDTLFYNPLQNNLFVSASTGRSSLTTSGYAFSSGSGATAYQARLTKSEISQTAGAGYTIGISGNPSSTGYTGLTTSTNPGVFAASGSGESYIAIELQASQSFTDGRVTIKRPLIAEQGSEITGSVSISGNVTASLQQGYVWVGDASGKTTTVATSSFGGGGTDLGPLNTFTSSQEVLNAQFADTGSNTFNGNQIVNGVVTQNVTAPADDTQSDFISVTGATIGGVPYNYVNQGFVNYPGFGAAYSDAFITEYYDSLSYNFGAEFIVNGGRVGGTLNASGSGNAASFRIQDQYDGTTFGNFYADEMQIGEFVAGTNTRIGIGHTALPILELKAQNVEITGSVTISGSINTSVIPLAITSNTASLNASSGSTFQLNLVSGSATRLEISGTQSGQTINLLVSQSASGPGTLVFGDNIVEPSGSFYSASTVASAEDILTMATFINPSKLYVANVKNFI